MIIFKISNDLNKKELEIVKETLLSLDINWQETMIIDENLYRRYIQIVSSQIENFGEVSKIKSNIVINGIVMKQPPKPTIKTVLDILLQFIEKQEKFNEEQKASISKIQAEQARQNNLMDQIDKLLHRVIKLNSLKV